MTPGSDCDCANMTLGEVDYIVGGTESNNYVMLKSAILNRITRLGMPDSVKVVG